MSIKDARTARDAANASYEAQVVAAYHSGRSMAEIAREAGVSRQRVWKIIQQAPAPSARPLISMEPRASRK